MVDKNTFQNKDNDVQDDNNIGDDQVGSEAVTKNDKANVK